MMLILIIFATNALTAFRSAYGYCEEDRNRSEIISSVASRLQHCFRRYYFNESLSANVVLGANPLRLLLDAKYLNASCK